ncbi:phosphoribosylformylglycinamidine synthase subunit PurS [soil metagenome]|jgi:phosphoribosylformylglycinamidine synthase
MNAYEVEVRITPRAGLLDPQGNAVAGALASLGFAGVDEVHVGRLLVLQLEAAAEEEARDMAERMCRRLLANPVTEDYRLSVRETAAR